MTFYCVEKAKGRGCSAKETLGIPQCHYCYEYQRGYVEPSSPVPVTTLNALIAVPYENIMPLVKAWLLEDKS